MGLKLVNKLSEKESAEILFNMIQERRKLERKEKDLKDHFKKMMENSGVTVMKVGDFIITLDDRKTTSIDRQMLAEELGINEAKKFEKEINYKVLDLKKAA